MSQVLIDNNGIEAGVFLSKQDWNLVKSEINNWDKKLSFFENENLPTFSQEFLNNLDKSQKEPLSESVNAKEFIKKIRNKYAL
jgi:hypothetical protein